MLFVQRYISSGSELSDTRRGGQAVNSQFDISRTSYSNSMVATNRFSREMNTKHETAIELHPERRESNYFRRAGIVWFIIVPFGMGLLALLAFFFPPSLPKSGSPSNGSEFFQLINFYVLKAFQSQYVLQIIFYLAVAIHVAEALVAYFVATKMGCFESRGYWAAQTLLLGYPSLRLLLQKRRDIPQRL
jgi:Domain of unknown function (DUF4499)